MSYPNGFEDAPTYLSGHMADVVLSEFRPTRIKPDALRCVNVLLDELLWSVIKSARSVNTEKIKSDGILRVIPAALGKEAVLEAEMELREYWKTSGDSRETYRDMKENPASFPIAQVFDVMRLKCEANSSLGQAEEEDNIAVEKAEQRLYQVRDAPPIEAFAPASLYLTAILEHVCGHIMSCVSRVVARDSSKTSASISDLHSALCEDQALYNMVKGMNAFTNIEAQHRASRVQRKGSFSGSLVSARSRAAAASPRPGYEPASASPTTTSRTSGDSSGHSLPAIQTNVPSAQAPVRSPSERKRVPPLYPTTIIETKVSAPNGRTSYDNTMPQLHKRSNSGMSEATKHAMTHMFQSDPNMTSVDDGEGSEFEELMRTGSTMKVSLTPDRLRTFEVFNKDRNQRAANKAAATVTAGQYGPESGSLAPAPPPQSMSSSLSSSYGPGGRPSTGRSSSPTNDGYSTDSAVGSRRPNSRQASRVRLEAIPQLPSQRSIQALQIDEFGGRQTPPSSWGQPQAAPLPARPRTTEARTVPSRQPPFLDGASKKPSYGHTGNIAPLYEEMDSFPEAPEERSRPKPKPAPIAAPSAPREPRVSSSARDLIAFLDEGPPEIEPPMMSRSVSTASGLESNGTLKKSASRGFMNSLKGLARGPDKGVRGGPEEIGSLRGLVRRQKSSHTLANTAMSSSTMNIPPPSPVKPVPPRIALDSKDSIPGIGSRYRDGAPPTKPVPQPMPQKHDIGGPDTHAVALPTPPASHESPPMRSYAAHQAAITTPSPNRTAPPPRMRITPANTAPNSPSSADEYGTAPYGTHTRIAVDKVIEQPIAIQVAAPNGSPVPVPVTAEEQLRLLQKLVQTAGNIEECRLLVDSFLMQRGMKADGAAPGSPAPPSLPSTPILKPLPPSPADEEAKERGVIDWLLSGDTEYSATGEKAAPKLTRPKSRDRTISANSRKSRERLRK